MAARPAPAAPAQGWAGLLVALALFAAVPVLPPLRALLPVEQTLVLLLPVLAACCVAGWWFAGGASLLIGAAVAAIVAVLAVGRLLPADTRDVARAWGLLGAGVFGLVCVAGTQARSFFPRALATVGLLVLLALVLVTVEGLPFSWLRDRMVGELAGRNAAAVLGVPARMQPVNEWLHLPAEAAEAWAANYVHFLRQLSALAIMLFPSLLALELMAALALGWALYHRLSRTPIGPALAPFHRFTFSGQLLWGVAAGLALALVPTLSPLAPLGVNLVGFFSALFGVRGLAVIVWFTARRHWGVRAALIALLLLALSVAAFTAVELAVGLCLVLGMTDVVVDWRDLRPSAPEPERARPGVQ
ncbi:MAG TPA: DUF2232 domain-containing protein [Gemmatimonadaceae bacterium]|nr:DUF2232 domain-containing protein [Gemmatimonadaceae bacterium]